MIVLSVLITIACIVTIERIAYQRGYLMGQRDAIRQMQGYLDVTGQAAKRIHEQLAAVRARLEKAGMN